jgi:hypothetical protein
MQRWCGGAFAKIQHQRQVLAPFFDRSFIEYAFSQPAAEKADSRSAAQLLAAMDPGLARIPLDNGQSPARMFDRSLAGRAGKAMIRFSKIRRRVIQRLSRGSLVDANSADVGAQWCKRVGPSDLNLQALAAWGVFRPKALEDFAEGKWRPNRATLGFILNCAYLVDALEAP